MRKGQFGVIHTTGKYATSIGFFQGLRMPHQYARFTHALIAVDDDNVVEAMPEGVCVNVATEYQNIVWSDFDHTQAEADAIASFVLDQVGKPYAWEDIPLIAVALATGEHTPDWLETKLSSDQRWICSELVDAAFAHAEIPLFHGIPPAAVYPAMLAKLLEA